VHSEPGTTRDPVDTAVEIGGQRYLVIDTAGIRRHARISLDMDKIAVAMAEKAISRADVCVLLIDAQQGVAEQDARITGLGEQAGRALVIAFNKADLILEAEREQRRQEVARQLQFVPWARVVFVSARTGQGVEQLLAAVRDAYAAFTRRVRTAELNRWFEGIVERHPPSLYRGHPVKLYFIQQPQARPPTFLFSVNHPAGVHFSYRRYLANQLRQSFGLDGTPVRLIFRERTRTRRKRQARQ
jgi:GTP-binding protein